MVLRGKLRGNGSQLAGYLLKKADNDNVRLLAIRGTGWETDLRQSLIEMSLTSELTKTDKGLYHVQICPAYGEDQRMTDTDWQRAADILEAETGYVGQKRAIVLHDKKGKVHAHVVWERYDHDKGTMIPNKFSRLAQDRARVQMEKEFEQVRTPERNRNRPEMKEYLTDIWLQTKDAASFMQAINDKGYIVASGTQRPYMVIDETGRSFNLVRQLDNVRTSEVRERFKTMKLVKEKEAIEQVRNRQKAEKIKQQAAKTTNREILKTHANDNSQQITVSQEPSKAKDKTYTMQVKIEMPSHVQKQASDQLKDVVEKIEQKQLKKQALLEKLKQERLQRAKEFRENERDL